MEQGRAFGANYHRLRGLFLVAWGRGKKNLRPAALNRAQSWHTFCSIMGKRTTMEINKAYKNSFDRIKGLIDRNLDDAYHTICALCQENGGLLKTPAAYDKETLYAHYEDWEGKVYAVPIHGFRYDEEQGLTICTNEMLDNYQFDTGYCFEYYFDFTPDTEDYEHLQKALADAAYFVEFDRYGLQRVPTLLSIINGIGDYL